MPFTEGDSKNPFRKDVRIMSSHSEDLTVLLEDNPILTQPSTRRLVTRCVAHALDELGLLADMLATIRSYAATLPSTWSQEEKSRVVAALVGYLRAEMRSNLRSMSSNSAEPAGFDSLSKVMRTAHQAWELGDPMLTGIDAPDFAQRLAALNRGDAKPHWPLRVAPKWYLSRYPIGEYSDIARQLIGEEAPEAPAEEQHENTDADATPCNTPS